MWLASTQYPVCPGACAAVQATCLSAVKQLHQLGVLDDYLRPCRDHTHSRTLAQSLTSADVKQRGCAGGCGVCI